MNIHRVFGQQRCPLFALEIDETVVRKQEQTAKWTFACLVRTFPINIITTLAVGRSEGDETRRSSFRTVLGHPGSVGCTLGVRPECEHPQRGIRSRRRCSWWCRPLRLGRCTSTIPAWPGPLPGFRGSSGSHAARHGFRCWFRSCRCTNRQGWARTPGSGWRLQPQGLRTEPVSAAPEEGESGRMRQRWQRRGQSPAKSVHKVLCVSQSLLKYHRSSSTSAQ